MKREHYVVFSQGRIGHLTLSNRLVRSATWDPCILEIRQMTDEVLNLYRELAAGGVGLIITGGLPVFRERSPGKGSGKSAYSYHDLRVDGIEKMAEAIHSARADCKVVAQLETGYLNAGPSELRSPFTRDKTRPLGVQEIHQIVNSFVQAMIDMRKAGFDGVQLHAAHGGLLSRFLSPYSNHRADEYGGSIRNRARIVREIVAKAREKVGDWPILIKMNCTDYVEGGISIDTFPELAKEIEDAGVDAIEISGGMWDCLARPEAELGFRPVSAPESHTRIARAEKELFSGICTKARPEHSCDSGWRQPERRAVGRDPSPGHGGLYCLVPASDPRAGFAQPLAGRPGRKDDQVHFVQLVPLQHDRPSWPAGAWAGHLCGKAGQASARGSAGMAVCVGQRE